MASQGRIKRVVSFIVFTNAHKSRLKSMYPFLSPGQIQSKLKDLWNNLTTQEKQQYTKITISSTLKKCTYKKPSAKAKASKCREVQEEIKRNRWSCFRSSAGYEFKAEATKTYPSEDRESVSFIHGDFTHHNQDKEGKNYVKKRYKLDYKIPQIIDNSHFRQPGILKEDTRNKNQKTKTSVVFSEKDSLKPFNSYEHGDDSGNSADESRIIFDEVINKSEMVRQDEGNIKKTKTFGMIKESKPDVITSYSEVTDLDSSLSDDNTFNFDEVEATKLHIETVQYSNPNKGKAERGQFHTSEGTLKNEENCHQIWERKPGNVMSAKSSRRVCRWAETDADWNKFMSPEVESGQYKTLLESICKAPRKRLYKLSKEVIPKSTDNEKDSYKLPITRKTLRMHLSDFNDTKLKNIRNQETSKRLRAKSLLQEKKKCNLDESDNFFEKVNKRELTAYQQMTDNKDENCGSPEMSQVYNNEAGYLNSSFSRNPRNKSYIFENSCSLSSTTSSSSKTLTDTPLKMQKSNGTLTSSQVSSPALSGISQLSDLSGDLNEDFLLPKQQVTAAGDAASTIQSVIKNKECSSTGIEPKDENEGALCEMFQQVKPEELEYIKKRRSLSSSRTYEANFGEMFAGGRIFV